MSIYSRVGVSIYSVRWIRKINSRHCRKQRVLVVGCQDVALSRNRSCLILTANIIISRYVRMRV